LYPDPILAYRHDGQTPKHIVAALEDIHERAATGALTKPMYIERAARLLQLTPEQAEKIFFGSQDRNRELVEYLGILRPTYKVAMLTNAGQGVIESLFSAEERQRYFDVIVETHAVGTPKPDPAIFRWACQQVSVEPSEAVMIDDRQENLASAQAIGMQAIQFYSYQQTHTDLEAMLNATAIPEGPAV
jgi:HAD superfamily hydrolase (TIGR01509 family)